MVTKIMGMKIKMSMGRKKGMVNMEMKRMVRQKRAKRAKEMQRIRRKVVKVKTMVMKMIIDDMDL
jgi:hypothetical protein